MTALLQDLRFALRQLRKSPGFTLFAVLVMALGIGANTAVFSVVNAVLLRPLAYPHPDRIVTLSSLWKTTGNTGWVSAPDFHDWHDQSTLFAAMAYYGDDDEAVAVGSNSSYAHVATVMPEFFRVFEVQPSKGRLFSADEQKPGSAGAAVISHAYWQRHFAGSVNPFTQSVRMFGKTLNIVGVMPPGFNFPDKTDIWFPAETIFHEETSRSAHNYSVVGRLKDGVSLQQAQTQMTAIAARLEQQYPPSNQYKSVAVSGLRDTMVNLVGLTLYLLLGAVAVVLLIACANVAGLQLAKATARTREIALRAALGASRARIVRQLLTESLLLALLSGAAGLLLANWGSHLLIALAPGDIPRLTETGVDRFVLLFTLGVSVLASFLFGLAPALQVSRIDLSESLKQSTTRMVNRGGAGRTRNALVVAEIALSIVLLAGAGLLLKSLIALHNVTMGFRPGHVLVMGSSVPALGKEEAKRATHFYTNLLPQISALPGVTAVGATRTLPGQVMSYGTFWLEHVPQEFDMNNGAGHAVFSIVAPGTFQTVGIPLKRGRDFDDSDNYDAPLTAVINESLARQAFPGQDPIGHVVVWGLDGLIPMRIVGIVGDTRQHGPASDPDPEIYAPYQQHPFPGHDLNVMVRTTTDPGLLSETLRRKVHELSPDVPVKFTTLQDSLGESFALPRFRTLLLGIFAGLAVCLAMAGIYAVMAYVVGQRQNEIGLRMALGSSRAGVLRLILRQGLRLTAFGVVLGLVAAIAASRLLTSMLFEVKPADPLTYIGAVALIAFVALVASYIPARRAAKLDPMVALRYE